MPVTNQKSENLTDKFNNCLIKKFLKISKPDKYIFILGHMRSGSTLLLHILSSNPGIISGGERNKKYNNISNLCELTQEICLQEKIYPLNKPYMLDQINHNHMTPNIAVLNNKNLKVIYLLREPAPTISSIIRTFEPIYGNWPAKRAVEYYINRLKYLVDLAPEITQKSNNLLIKYEALSNQTPDTLDKIQKFLSISKPLTANYKIQGFTGTRGDPSDVIKTGKVLRNLKDDLEDIPEELLQSANEVYQNAIKIIDDQCSIT